MQISNSQRSTFAYMPPHTPPSVSRVTSDCNSKKKQKQNNQPTIVCCAQTSIWLFCFIVSLRIRLVFRSETCTTTFINCRRRNGNSSEFVLLWDVIFLIWKDICIAYRHCYKQMKKKKKQKARFISDIIIRLCVCDDDSCWLVMICNARRRDKWWTNPTRRNSCEAQQKEIRPIDCWLLSVLTDWTYFGHFSKWATYTAYGNCGHRCIPPLLLFNHFVWKSIAINMELAFRAQQQYAKSKNAAI